MKEEYLLKKEVLVEWGRTGDRLTTKMAEDLAKFDLTAQQFNVLRILRGALPEILCAKQIRERLVDRNADVSRLIGRLEEKNLLELLPAEHDKRQKDLVLTSQGKSILSLIDQELPNYPYSFLDVYSEAELQTLRELFSKIPY